MRVCEPVFAILVRTNDTELVSLPRNLPLGASGECGSAAIAIDIRQHFGLFSPLTFVCGWSAFMRPGPYLLHPSGRRNVRRAVAGLDLGKFVLGESRYVVSASTAAPTLALGEPKRVTPGVGVVDVGVVVRRRGQSEGVRRRIATVLR